MSAEIEILSIPPGPDAIYSNANLTPEQKREWEQGLIDTGLPLPPLDLLPEGSLLREEWHRRAEAAQTQRS